MKNEMLLNCSVSEEARKNRSNEKLRVRFEVNCLELPVIKVFSLQSY
jgi:hypothetical protein